MKYLEAHIDTPKTLSASVTPVQCLSHFDSEIESKRLCSSLFLSTEQVSKKLLEPIVRFLAVVYLSCLAPKPLKDASGSVTNSFDLQGRDASALCQGAKFRSLSGV